ncbi:DUF2235 domain-containing protein [Crenobacter sp. SG2303]|uniref:DUF2235 domain-containing protein n=1 Tax=Crenobacter oryzisoli TaxID=3056844 RepID=A0ABT7XL34_9NEIS|nr:DUF2235 domain-containing protein [Crenobacter sp. SG2303]MDN0074502.1 DUF2235 domain-containing protein [Crenobacter sp. SG2303]
MTKMCSPAPASYSNPCDRDNFFSASDKNKLIDWEKRELRPICNPNASCDFNLFFGFFFDGTRNNYNLIQSDEGFTNVARLYDCYPGLGVDGVIANEPKWENVKNDYPHFFKVYVPGVGTPFKQVEDTGKGMDATFGAGMALYGHERIVWGLMQAVNNLHRYFLGSALVPDAEVLQLSKQLVITGWSLKNGGWLSEREMRAGRESTFDVLRKVLKKLHGAIKDFLPGPDGKPANMSKGKVGHIHLSVFGFSRGATKARSFSNWMQRLCELDAELTENYGQKTLGGFPVSFDFLGIFDTVASVGLASSTLLFDGHAEWADAEQSLRVPMGMPCLHLVAGHEIRRSFPLDSIEAQGVLPANSEEILFPGVHSDVGGGYCPKDQGRGATEKGHDMLSRIPLAVMYRKARLSGVPLKAEKMPTAVQYRMQVDPKLIEDFNAYLATVQRKEGKYKYLLRDLYWPYIAWRLTWVDKLDNASLKQHFDNLQGAKNADVNELLGANKRLAEHLSYFRSWMRQEKVSIGRLTRDYYPPPPGPEGGEGLERIQADLE